MADGTDNNNTPPNNEPPKNTPPVDKNVPPPADGGAKGADEFEKERKKLLDEIHSLRENGRDTKKERDELKARLDAIEEDKLKEEKKYKELYEKEAKEKAQIKQDSRKRLLKTELRAAAIAEGILDPEAADLIDINDLMDGDEDSAIVKVRERVTEHKAKKPQWYNAPGQKKDETPPPPSTGPANKPPAPGAKPGEVNVADMSKEEYAKYKREHLREIRNRKRGK